MIESCPFCGLPTLLTDRRYDPEGFPYVHVCDPPIHVPNEQDFCPVCGTLAEGICPSCIRKPLRQAAGEAQRRGQKNSARIHPVRAASEGLEL